MTRPRIFARRQSLRDDLARNQRAFSYLAPDGIVPEALRTGISDPGPKRAAPVKRDGPSEADVSDEIRAVARKVGGVVLYRNTRGKLREEGGRWISYGVGPNGAADYIGWRSVRVTNEMVGGVIAQFVAIEAKRPGERLRDDQAEFLRTVEDAGGRAGTAWSGEHALEILRG